MNHVKISAIEQAWPKCFHGKRKHEIGREIDYVCYLQIFNVGHGGRERTLESRSTD